MQIDLGMTQGEIDFQFYKGLKFLKLRKGSK